ncbi:MULTISPECIES: hypothetical protein [Lactobacillaceae]|uniref:hypothetical protein n=1 Tax=Lactobacillaceae TaxID=33958 RepID=UPI0014574451|nr:hypothetical protein [Lactobacillus sp. HBUAS51381]NLR09191.1 hypothetical protein [Lactobacillus sp. HBUAS51381]
MLKMNRKLKGLLKFVTLLGIGISLLGAGGITANASKKAYWGHFDSKRITYHIDSTSKHYRGIWKSAIKNWNSQHVVKLINTNKKSNADIRLTSIAGTLKSQRYSGVNDNTGNVIIHSSMKLHRVFMDDGYYKYSTSDRISVASQALGYSLGLKLNKSAKSVMNSYQFRNHITPSDRANLKAAYKGVK